MTPAVTPIPLGSGPFSVNCYLIRTDDGFVLVDTGMRSHRSDLVGRLAEEGVTADTLRLVVITHGDFDHIGNAAHLRQEFRAPLAMHAGDVKMGSEGDMFSGRKPPKPVVKTLLPLLARLPQTDRFEPDELIDESSDLAGYGLPGARVLLLRGHSAGSIALLLPGGSLICGDVLENRSEPKLGSIMDDVPVAEASVARLKGMGIGTVYPGHGRPFEMASLTGPRIAAAGEAGPTG